MSSRHIPHVVHIYVRTSCHTYNMEYPRASSVVSRQDMYQVYTAVGVTTSRSTRYILPFSPQPLVVQLSHTYEYCTTTPRRQAIKALLSVTFSYKRASNPFRIRTYQVESTWHSTSTSDICMFDFLPCLYDTTLLWA